MPTSAQTARRGIRPRAIDLFSGAGGLTRGLRDAGFTVIGAVEQDDLAAESYRFNFPRVRLWESDIRNIAGSEILKTLGLRPGQLELLAGCPPCEGFSTLRTRNGHDQVNDPLNDLITEFGRLVTDLLPRYVMLENVPALAQDSRFHDYVALLQGSGYSVRHQSEGRLALRGPAAAAAADSDSCLGGLQGTPGRAGTGSSTNGSARAQSVASGRSERGQVARPR